VVIHNKSLPDEVSLTGHHGNAGFGSLFRSGDSSRFIIKCSNEEEMVDWIAAIQTKLESYDAELAPEPILASYDKIRANVEAAMEKHHTTANDSSETLNSSIEKLKLNEKTSSELSPQIHQARNSIDESVPASAA